MWTFFFGLQSFVFSIFFAVDRQWQKKKNSWQFRRPLWLWHPIDDDPVVRFFFSSQIWPGSFLFDSYKPHRKKSFLLKSNPVHNKHRGHCFFFPLPLICPHNRGLICLSCVYQIWRTSPLTVWTSAAFMQVSQVWTQTTMLIPCNAWLKEAFINHNKEQEGHFNKHGTNKTPTHMELVTKKLYK